MTARNRLAFIEEHIQENKRVTVSELSELCNVTEETIRKDLNKLESDGVLLRVHGGAIYNERTEEEEQEMEQEAAISLSPVTESHFAQRKTVHQEMKRRMAEYAVRLIPDGATLFTDSSTSVSEVLSALPATMDLTIVTNSTYILTEPAAMNFHILSTGGAFNPKYLSLQGAVAMENVEKYTVDYALISCKAVDLERGVQDSSEGEAQIKKAMLEHCKKVILLADHTKFDQLAFVELTEAANIDYLVTDRMPDERWRTFCKENGICLVYE